MKQTKTAAAKIRAYVKQHPKAKPNDIAAALEGVTLRNVYATLSYDKKAKKGIPRVPRKSAKVAANKWKTLAIITSNDTVNAPDNVNHPAHYKVGGIETIDFIEAKKLGYNLGNVVKYLTRADHKGNKLEDLRKAQWYLTREISMLK